MIEGFEKETSPLSEEEKNLLPVFVRCLSKKIGKKNAVSNKKIEKGFKKQSIEIASPRVRKIINHIRRNHLIPNLCACSSGYYCAENDKELKEYLTGLRQRISAIQEVLNSFEKKL